VKGTIGIRGECHRRVTAPRSRQVRTSMRACIRAIRSLAAGKPARVRIGAV
jgi:hypothetical protein